MNENSTDLGAPFLVFLFCLWGIYIGIRHLFDIDYAWEQQKKHLLKKGIDPSNMKRNSEWETSNGCRAVIIVIMAGLGLIASGATLLHGLGI